jgi:hypothetical protein
MITCFIRYQIDSAQTDEFRKYAWKWGEVLPRCGIDLIGYFAPHGGSPTLAYGVYNVESLAAYETYRERLETDPGAQENFAFARERKFVLREDRSFHTLASAPHALKVKR